MGYMVGAAMANLTGDWRWGIRITPFLNIIAVVFMIFFCQDPARGESDTEGTKAASVAAEGTATKNQSSWSAYLGDLKYLMLNKTFVLTTLAFTSLTFCTGSLAWWAPSYMEDAIKVRESEGLDSPIGTDEYG